MRYIAYLLVLIIFSNVTFAESKPNLVILPLGLESEHDQYKDEFETALQEGLQSRYTVFYGDIVSNQLEKEYSKLDCTAESCMQNIAIAFNGELVADASVKSVSNGYLLKLVIKNVITDQVMEPITKSCRECDEIALIDSLKELGRGTKESLSPAVSMLTSSASAIITSDKWLPYSANIVSGEIKNEGKAAMLILESQPSSADVYINGKKVGNTPFRDLNRTIGERLTIYVDDNINQPFVVDIVLTEPIVQIDDINFKTGKVRAQIITDPVAENASIYVDGKNIGKAPLVAELTSGKHDIFAKGKKGTSRTLSTVFAVGSEQLITLPLNENRVATSKNVNFQELSVISVDSIPQGVDVKVNGFVKGQTPLLFESSNRGQQVLIEIDGLAYRTERIELIPSENITVIDPVKLKKGRGTLAIAVDDFSAKNKIFINGDYAGKAPVSVDVPSGNYQVYVKNGKLISKVENVALHDGDVEQVVLSAPKPKPKAVKTKSVKTKNRYDNFVSVESQSSTGMFVVDTVEFDEFTADNTSIRLGWGDNDSNYYIGYGYGNLQYTDSNPLVLSYFELGAKFYFKATNPSLYVGGNFMFAGEIEDSFGNPFLEEMGSGYTLEGGLSLTNFIELGMFYSSLLFEEDLGACTYSTCLSEVSFDRVGANLILRLKI